VKPNPEMVAAMAKLARDIESLASHNDQIAATYRMMSVAFARGDLVDALARSRAASAMADDSRRRCDIVINGLRLLPLVDPVAWSVAQRELDATRPKPPVTAVVPNSLAAQILANLVSGLTGKRTELTRENAGIVIGELNVDQCRAVIEAHGELPCNDPNCNIVDAAKQRIAQLGGVP